MAMLCSTIQCKKYGPRVDPGILEIKMKKKLVNGPDLVPIGCITSGKTKQSKKKKEKGKSNKKAKFVKQKSFKDERNEIMEKLCLPNPTKKVVQQHVVAVKQETQAKLPALSGAFKKRKVPKSNFPTAYNRGEIPALIQQVKGGKSLKWTKDLDSIDFTYYLPLFMEGVREPAYPYCFIAKLGSTQLLEYGAYHPQKVHACLHRLVPPIRLALNTRDPNLICTMLQNLRKLLTIEGIGVALVPYYRQLLPVFNIFKSRRQNIGDSIHYSQRNETDVDVIIQETLELMEKTGGEDAYVNLKYMIPTYEGINIRR